MPVLDLRPLPPPERHRRVHEQLDGLAPGETLELVNDHRPSPLRYELEATRGKGTPVLGLRLALGFLVLTAAFGVTYAFDRQAFWFGLLPRRVLAHAHLGLLGWLGLAYVAVAEKLWRIRLTSVEVLALAGWLGLAIVGHAHKIVPFIAWSSLRARGVTTGPDGTPLLFAHLFDHPTARLTFATATTGVAAALTGAGTGTALLVRVGGTSLAATGVLALANLGLGPRRVAAHHPQDEGSQP